MPTQGLPPVYVYASPGIGGANSELLATLKMWRRFGVACHIYTTPSALAEQIYRLGFRWQTLPERGQPVIPPHSIIIGFCNGRFRDDAQALREAGHKLIYAPCMNWLFPAERKTLLFDRYIFQSHHQRESVMPMLERIGLRPEHGIRIRAAFDPSEFPFNPKPHKEGEPFVIGRISRAYGSPGHTPALDKFPHDLWDQVARINYRPLSVRIMGWSPEIERYCGKPPIGAECLPEGAETPQHFLSTLHALVPGIGCCEENWPRIGLEAAAAGVPLVVESKGGWMEQHPAFIASTVTQQSAIVESLARNERLRLDATLSQRAFLDSQDWEVDYAWPRWKEIFESLA
jgi:hypothetical protein